PADGDGTADVYVRDLVNNTTELISQNTGNTQKGNGASHTYQSAISADGRYVVFVSGSTNLDALDPTPDLDVYLRDRQSNTTTVISRSGATKGDGPSTEPAISSDGTKVVFTTAADNLVATDPDTNDDVIERDWAADTN